MRSAPASTAASKRLREPSMLRACVRSLAVRTANARWMTASAPFTASRTLAFSVTSPWRYSVLRRPASFGSKRPRAMPTIFRTRRERSSARRIDIPRSPVGPVTATVRPSAAMALLYRLRASLEALRSGRRLRQPVLAAVQDVERVGHDGVDPGPAPDVVAAAVLRVHVVVARAGGDRVPSPAGGHAIVAGARDHPIAPGTRVDREGPAVRPDD